MNTVFYRKIVTASVSGTIFVFLLGIAMPNPFGDENIVSYQNYFYSSISIMPIYMLYSFPCILTYGVITSMISDKIGQLLLKKTDEVNIEIIVSGALHLIFGLVLFWFSLVASILFFIIDRLFKKVKNDYGWKDAFRSLVIPTLMWLFLMGVVWANDILLIL
ncbi:hypothetical protein [Bacillus sp. Marseille-Q3570]|uniref:hypothetical protein n=1 Tax=Bacillus sp. Marseille-Q3570 TaxID=2963522 RepID=UPI0021B73191|nr:hypothetical protein [Bacillus sp. Marseille-Q3570]